MHFILKAAPELVYGKCVQKTVNVRVRKRNSIEKHCYILDISIKIQRLMIIINIKPQKTLFYVNSCSLF